MSKPIEDAADIISQQNALIEELQAKLADQAAPVVAASPEPVSGAFLNKNGGVTLTGAPIEEMPKRHAFAGYLYAAPATPAAQAQQPAGDGWIACADRMPAEADPVLVYVPGDPGLKIWIDTWQEQFDCPVAWSTAEVSIGPGWDDHEFEEVTHWMPLPLPPAPGLMEAE